MRTLLVSGSDTGVGKTWVVRLLSRYLLSGPGSPSSVQVVKPLETGWEDGGLGDLEAVASGADPAWPLTLHRLHGYRAPLAPLEAARLEGRSLPSIADLADQIKALPSADWCLVEGAGGIAVPLDGEGRDWSDLGKALGVAFCLLVVDNRLGAINQSRLAAQWAGRSGIPVHLWLNQQAPVAETVLHANRTALDALGLSLAGISGPGQERPVWLQEDLFKPEG